MDLELPTGLYHFQHLQLPGHQVLLLPTQPQAQELPGQDAAPGCRWPFTVQVEHPAVMAMFEPIPVWPYRLGGLTQNGEMRWVTGRWTAWTRRGGWWRTLDTHDSSKEGSRSFQ